MNKNVASLVVGFNALASALQKLGGSIGDMAPSTTVIAGGGNHHNTGATGRTTELVRKGNPAISDFRRFVESSRQVPA